MKNKFIFDFHAYCYGRDVCVKNDKFENQTPCPYAETKNFNLYESWYRGYFDTWITWLDNNYLYLDDIIENEQLNLF